MRRCRILSKCYFISELFLDTSAVCFSLLAILTRRLTFAERVGEAIGSPIEVELSRRIEIAGRRCRYRVVLRRGLELGLIVPPRGRVRGYSLQFRGMMVVRLRLRLRLQLRLRLRLRLRSIPVLWLWPWLINDRLLLVIRLIASRVLLRGRQRRITEGLIIRRIVLGQRHVFRLRWHRRGCTGDVIPGRLRNDNEGSRVQRQMKLAKFVPRWHSTV